MEQSRRIRIVAAGLGVLFIGLAASLIAIPLLIRTPLPVASPGASVQLADLRAGSPFGARLQVGDPGDVTLTLVFPDQRRPATEPQVRFDMPGLPMETVEAQMRRRPSGAIEARGRLPAFGRWRARIVTDGAVEELMFVLAEF